MTPISAQTKFAAVLGHPVEHSKSPAMHNAAMAAMGIDACYLALDVSPADLPDAIAGLSAMHCFGANLTIPHKPAVLPLCDSLSAAARDIGAVNTLEFCADGTLVGHNTDAEGYVRAFVEAVNIPIQGLRVVLLGGGGAARSIACGLRQAGAGDVQTVARSPQNIAWTTATQWSDSSFAQVLPHCDLLVDCTSIGLSEKREAGVAIPLHHLPEFAVVSTLIYHRQTELLRMAQKRGLRTVDGAGMLVHQGALALEIWAKQAAPIDSMRRALSGL